MKTVCLFCGSLDGSDPFFSKNAAKFGEILAKKQYSFLYGGGSLGLMGIAAKSALKHKVKVISIIPEYLDKPNIIFSKSDEIIKTKTLTGRKEKMIKISDIFVQPSSTKNNEQVFILIGKIKNSHPYLDFDIKD